MKSLKQVLAAARCSLPSGMDKAQAAVTLWRRHRAVYSKFQNRW